MTCAFHDAGAICNQCPERFDTDGKGFPHPAERKGRQALRVCAGCRQAKPIELWNVESYFHCLECTPGSSGQVSDVPRETSGHDLEAMNRGRAARGMPPLSEAQLQRRLAKLRQAGRP